MSVKLLVVGTKTVEPLVYPKITLDEMCWQEDSLVLATCENERIILKPCGHGISAYKAVVTDVRKNRGQLFYATKDELIIDGDWLHRAGFRPGELIYAKKVGENVEIHKLSPHDVGLPDDMALSFTTVHFCARKTPTIRISQQFLRESEFKVGGSASLTHENNAQLFTIEKPISTSCSQRSSTRSDGSPTQLNIRYKKLRDVPVIEFRGRWLAHYGYAPGDVIVIAYKPNLIMLKKLDVATF